MSRLFADTGVVPAPIDPTLLFDRVHTRPVPLWVVGRPPSTDYVDFYQIVGYVPYGSEHVLSVTPEAYVRIQPALRDIPWPDEIRTVVQQNPTRIAGVWWMQEMSRRGQCGWTEDTQHLAVRYGPQRVAMFEQRYVRTIVAARRLFEVLAQTGGNPADLQGVMRTYNRVTNMSLGDAVALAKTTGIHSRYARHWNLRHQAREHGKAVYEENFGGTPTVLNTFPGYRAMWATLPGASIQQRRSVLSPHPFDCVHFTDVPGTEAETVEMYAKLAEGMLVNWYDVWFATMLRDVATAGAHLFPESAGLVQSLERHYPDFFRLPEFMRSAGQSTRHNRRMVR